MAIRFPDAATAVQLEERHRALPISAYCWLMKPLVIDHVMRSQADIDWCCFLDSDMMAFANPASRLAQARERSVVVTPHAFRYPAFFGTEYQYGFYNAGFLAFRQSPKAREILAWWCNKCLAHCPPFPEPDAFGDQKYVEQLVKRFADDVSIGFPSLNCAAWNIGQDEVQRIDGKVTWRGLPILIYHFQGLRLLRNGWTDLYSDEFRLSPSVREFIYRPYVAALKAATRDVEATGLVGTPLSAALPLKEFAFRFARTLLGHRNIVRW